MTARVSWQNGQWGHVATIQCVPRAADGSINRDALPQELACAQAPTVGVAGTPTQQRLQSLVCKVGPAAPYTTRAPRDA